MLKIRPDQFRQFKHHVKQRFAAKLTGQLQSEYPEWFQCLPEPLAVRLVSDKIDYAQYRYEIQLQSSLTTFLHYCCSISPGFDLQPDIQEALDDFSHYPDDIPDSLPEIIGEEVWEHAAQQANKGYWFSQLTPLPEQVAIRLCWAMDALAKQQNKIQTPPDFGTLLGFCTGIVSYVQHYQITDAAGATAFAVCQSLLGRGFERQSARPWVPKVFGDPELLPVLRGPTLAGCVELEWGISL